MQKDKTKEQLKDRRDYRKTLIERRNSIDVKIAQTEGQIRKLESDGRS